jgi:hypothetical protein
MNDDLVPARAEPDVGLFSKTLGALRQEIKGTCFISFRRSGSNVAPSSEVRVAITRNSTIWGMTKERSSTRDRPRSIQTRLGRSDLQQSGKENTYPGQGSLHWEVYPRAFSRKIHEQLLVCFILLAGGIDDREGKSRKSNVGELHLLVGNTVVFMAVRQATMDDERRAPNFSAKFLLFLNGYSP